MDKRILREIALLVICCILVMPIPVGAASDFDVTNATTEHEDCLYHGQLINYTYGPYRQLTVFTGDPNGICWYKTVGRIYCYVSCVLHGYVRQLVA